MFGSANYVLFSIGLEHSHHQVFHASGVEMYYHPSVKHPDVPGRTWSAYSTGRHRLLAVHRANPEAELRTPRPIEALFEYVCGKVLAPEPKELGQAANNTNSDEEEEVVEVGLGSDEDENRRTGIELQGIQTMVLFAKDVKNHLWYS